MEHLEIVNDGDGEDQRLTFDALLTASALSQDNGRWLVLRHAEVVAAATDPATFSSEVSTRRAVPNSLDGASHTAFRTVVDRYLTDECVAREEAQCRQHAATIIDALPRGVTVKAVGSIGVPYAVRSQSTWLGWPPDIEGELVAWMRDNQAATRSGNRDRTAEIAERFDRIIHRMLDARRNSPPTDVTGALLFDTVNDRPLTEDEIVSILRNWTAGDLGSLATSVGVIVQFLAANREIQQDLRELARAADAPGLTAAVEEILRIDDPFVSNRRVTTCAANLGGEALPAGAQILLNWTAANRDPRVFHDPDRYAPSRNAAANLVFGVGPHVCPGRALTLMELRVLLEELFARTTRVDLAPDRPTVRESPPLGGWARVPVVLR